MLTSIDIPRPARWRDAAAEAIELRRRMQRPQRHRLLHGYPLAAAVPRIADGTRRDTLLPEPDSRRGLLVGVLPHPFCNPAVDGCGFCTFPHQAFTSRKAAVLIEHVVREIEQTLRARPGLAGRPVAGLYFGGGTANLSPPEPFRTLCRSLARAFDVAGAEVTLEGVPAAFVRCRPLLVDILREELPARHFRLSMGIQTFDTDRLRQMGRLGFGDARTFREVVEVGHARGFTVSGDLLFNLPAESLDQMRDDVRSAADAGLDHLGLYHLVMFAGLGTPWSRDPALLSSLPTNAVAAGNWLDLRALLHDLGFHQTTLTNFEQGEFRGQDRRFVYEELSFRPDRYDMIGFGPTGISFVNSGEAAVKVINPDQAMDYVMAVDRGWPTWDRAVAYGRRDLQVFFLTRRLAALRIERLDYQASFGSDPIDDFTREFQALEQEGLVRVTDEAIVPTALGMFYADSIAGLLSWKRLRAYRNRHRVGPVRGDHNGHGHM